MVPGRIRRSRTCEVNDRRFCKRLCVGLDELNAMKRNNYDSHRRSEHRRMACLSVLFDPFLSGGKELRVKLFAAVVLWGGIHASFGKRHRLSETLDCQIAIPAASMNQKVVAMHDRVAEIQGRQFL